ncbi:MAG: NRDE family protein [Saprospiraceae bacterium]|nr:NRDE family protein [Saprospiraceae bacterium]
MCTVTYIPQGRDSFILTSNRDEKPSRSPLQVTLTEQYGLHLIYPRDNGAGGTWIAASSDNRLVCVLNGAFEAHEKKPPYKRSRGLVALDFFRYRHACNFVDAYEFSGIEPFTMVIYDQGKLAEFRWDGATKHLQMLDAAEPHIWSSATLYDAAIRQKRQYWFDAWRHDHPAAGINEILDFHRTAGEGDPWNDVVMNREGKVQTVSITTVVKTPSCAQMQYHDMIRNNMKKAQIQLRGELVALY